MNSYKEKKELVNDVFDVASKKYDLMNDLMSLGVHRIWKKKVIDWIKPRYGDSLIDVASGTGDMAKLFSLHTKNKTKISCVEPNDKMYQIGKEKLKNFENISWIKASSENLPFKENEFDFYTISYGIRNVNQIEKCLSEAYRVLKPGGRFFCLEFSKIDNELIDFFYQKYSKVIPTIGSFFGGGSMPYKYLIESISKFYDQKTLKDLIVKSGFTNVEYRNLSNGISAIHTGWKI